MKIYVTVFILLFFSLPVSAQWYNHESQSFAGVRCCRYYYHPADTLSSFTSRGYLSGIQHFDRAGHKIADSSFDRNGQLVEASTIQYDSAGRIILNTQWRKSDGPAVWKTVYTAGKNQAILRRTFLNDRLFSKSRETWDPKEKRWEIKTWMASDTTSAPLMTEFQNVGRKPVERSFMNKHEILHYDSLGYFIGKTSWENNGGSKEYLETWYFNVQYANGKLVQWSSDELTRSFTYNTKGLMISEKESHHSQFFPTTYSLLEMEYEYY